MSPRRPETAGEIAADIFSDSIVPAGIAVLVAMWAAVLFGLT